MGSRVHEVHGPHEPASASIAAMTRAAVSQSPRVTSRCVTARTVRAPNATRSTPRRRASATNAAASASGRGQREDDDVGLDRRAIEVDAGEAGETVGDQRSVSVILGQARDVVIERVERGGGEEANLPHRPAEHAAGPDGARDDAPAGRRGALRPERRAPSRTPPTPRRTAPPAPRRLSPTRRPRSRAESHRGNWRCRGPAPRRRCATASRCGTTTPPERLWVFSTSTSVRRGIQRMAARLARRQDLLGGEHTSLPDLGELHAGVRRGRARLVPDGMALTAHDHVVTGSREQLAARPGWPSCRSAATAPPPCPAAARSVPEAG